MEMHSASLAGVHAVPDVPEHLQDGVELGAALRDATVAAGVSWADTPAAVIETTLRELERRRSTRCAPLVAQARQNGRRFTTPRSSWVGHSPVFCLPSTLPCADCRMSRPNVHGSPGILDCSTEADVLVLMQGLWLRDFMFKRFALNESDQFKHTLWDSPPLDKPALL